MSEQHEPLSRQERYGITRKKHITITIEGHDRLQAWADEHDVTFSAAIESLALIGTGSNIANAFPLLTTGILERVVTRQYNRFAKLLARTALAAEANNWKADVLLLQNISREAALDPDNFIANMTVSHDPSDTVATQIRQMRDEMSAAAHQHALQKQKLPLQDLVALIQKAGETANDGD